MKKGDKVRINDDIAIFHGRVATIVAVDEEGCVVDVGNYTDESGELIEYLHLFFERSELSKQE
ncbi:mind bomb SH3 repeat domain-containing protein [Pseudomonas phage EM]|uniref:Mind bomb SH3 repeat domain-containing protein n=1 Tax=Pseudomonas phage EM TaxID=2936914 RepID=A0AAE9KTZ2_9CAUD|nr:mind bomb SH3 repeat domain-containing protein [Pseudomonas phage EM]UPW35915.1 mind bomb SH3 repeat domain-containing protein [Pseudomonas phage EM]